MTELAPLEKHLPPEGEVDADSLLEGFLAYIEERGLELYPAQEEAILELFAGQSVILNTPTGSGKSLVASALCFKALAEGKRLFYTAPIKALVSEKFFDLCETLGPDHVGMMTGDATVNRDASIIACTAEILSNIALREGAEADVDYAVMDEFHYYSDRDRGVAWQVPLLTLPQARFLLMSATLGDTTRFSEGIEALTGAPCVLVKTTGRPVPLDFEYRTTPILETIGDLLESGRAPIYIVHFTHRAATERAQDLMSIDLLSKEGKRAILDELKGFRFDSPFGAELKRWVHHGIGIHYAGMLPKYRRMVERLAQRGLLRVICGTDTLGVGVNVPIRTVLFTQLCKYDGDKTRLLTVRDFQQIAGRAGRRGYDDHGSVLAQAPEHAIANETLRQKAAGDAKKMRKLKYKKPPEHGFVNWDEATFDRLRGGDPEPLESRFAVNHAFLLNVLSRAHEDGCKAMRSLIRASHESPRSRRRIARMTIGLFRSLLAADIVRMPEEGDDHVAVHEDLQTDFSLNQALSLFAVEVIDAMSPEEPSYAADVLSVIEATLEDPGVVLRRQLDTIKTRRLAELKAEGVEYEERMAELEKLDNPRPMAEVLYPAFETFREHHPWVAGENVRPKSIARDLWERGASFREYVNEYGLARAEGVLLRYLTDAYKGLVQNVPEDAKTDELYDLTESLGAIVGQVDASLIDEWRRMLDPEAKPTAFVEEVDETDITRDERAFKALIRNEAWRLVRALAAKRYDDAAALLAEAGGEAPDAAALEQSLAPYFEEHHEIRVDPTARNPRHAEILFEGDVWLLRQTLVDPEDACEWAFEVRIDLGRAREEARPILETFRVGPQAELLG